MLYPLAPLSSNKTNIDQREHILSLCSDLMKPGFAISSGMDRELAEALLSREIDRAALVKASLLLLRANPRVAEILDQAWRRDEAALDARLSDGTLIAFLNAPLLQALLYSSAIPDLSMERLLTHARKRFLDCAIDSNWNFNAATLKSATALSVHAFLTEYVFFESLHESELVDVLSNRLDGASTETFDPFDIAVVGSYHPLGPYGFSKRMKDAAWFSSQAAMNVLWRIQVEEPSRERGLAQAMPRVTAINDQMSQTVRNLYEENPYPRWVSYVRIDPLPPLHLMRHFCSGVDLDLFGDKDSIEALVAGCGTGITAIEEAVLWGGFHVLAVDLSQTSLAFGQRCCEDMGLTSVEFAQADILELPSWGRTFDYIMCTGVLHHMGDPVAGWKALVDVCRPGGVMRIGLYSEAARCSVRTASTYVKAFGDGSNTETIRKARQTLIDHAFRDGTMDIDLASVFQSFDFYTTSMCRDLLFHVHEIDFTIPKIEAAIGQLGLRFCGFVDPERVLLTKYQEFAPHDPKGLDLRSWTKFEAQYPDTFAAMYDFIVQKPLES